MDPPCQIDGRSAVEIKSAARKAEGGAVYQGRREDMGLAQAGHLLSQEHVDETDGIVCRGVRFAVVDGINGGERIVSRQGLIDARGPEVFPNVLDWIAERFGDSAGGSRRSYKLGAVRDRPKHE